MPGLAGLRARRRQRASASCGRLLGTGLLVLASVLSIPVSAAAPTPLLDTSQPTQALQASLMPVSFTQAVGVSGYSAGELFKPAAEGRAVEQLRQPAHLRVARPPRTPASFGTPSDAELRVLHSSGGHCTASIYRAAWDEAMNYHIEPVWIVAMIEAESACRPDAISKAGALGLMQLVPSTGARDAYRLAYGKDLPPGDALFRDPRINIRLGVAYLHGLNQHFVNVSSTQTRLLLAIASYNCGTDLIDAQLPIASAGWELIEAQRWIALHVPRETLRYITQVQAKALQYASAIQATRVAAGSFVP